MYLPTAVDTQVLNMVRTGVLMMVDETRTKILKVGSRHTMYLEKAFIEDSAFPFKPDERLKVRIEGKRLVVESG